jgi:hypothetical protein
VSVGEGETDYSVAANAIVELAMTRDSLTHSHSTALHFYCHCNVFQIYTGGNTRCIESSSPYNFVVRKGAASQVLYYFQGGGACWYCSVSRFLALCEV